MRTSTYRFTGNILHVRLVKLETASSPMSRIQGVNSTGTKPDRNHSRIVKKNELPITRRLFIVSLYTTTQISQSNCLSCWKRPIQTRHINDDITPANARSKQEGLRATDSQARSNSITQDETREALTFRFLLRRYALLYKRRYASLW